MLRVPQRSLPGSTPLRLDPSATGAETASTFPDVRSRIVVEQGNGSTQLEPPRSVQQDAERLSLSPSRATVSKEGAKVSGRKRLVLECGSHSLDGLGAKDTPLVERIHRLQRDAEQEEGIDLEVILYEGSSGLHRGVRPVSPPNEALPELIGTLNAAGIPFVYAMNGGLLHDDATLPDEGEMRVLDSLSSSGRSTGLKNKVVITRHALLPYLRSTYPTLEVIASCIQQISPRDCRPYAVKFQDYDYVVPLNQHTTYEYLKDLHEHADRLIVFLELTCGMIDARYCYSDYLSMEKVPWETIVRQLTTVPANALMPTGLAPADSGCNNPRAALITREHDLSGLIRMGVNIFKVSRAQQLLPDDYRQLTRLIREQQPEDVA